MNINRLLILSLLLPLALSPAQALPAPSLANTATRLIDYLEDVFIKVKPKPKAPHLKAPVLKPGSCEHALPQSEIDELAELACKPGGITEVGKRLGAKQLVNSLGDAGELVLQDTYLRIALKNGRINPKLAQETMEMATKVKPEGLTGLLSKINANGLSKSKGHLRELEIGLSAHKHGFQVVRFGERFNDGLKKADTDLDILLRQGKKQFAVESKAYTNTVPHDTVAGDVQSLLAYCKGKPDTVPLFCFETPPSALSLRYLKDNKVKCIIGSPDDIATKLQYWTASF